MLSDSNDGWCHHGDSNDGWCHHGDSNDGWCHHGDSNDGWCHHGDSNDAILHRCHRNVLVGENQNVKISDFGLSRILAKEDTYYLLSQAKKLPVKWMALESIEYRKFSTYSDSKTTVHC